MSDTIGFLWLAPFLWGLGGLVAIRLLGRDRRRAERPPETAAAGDVRRAA